jgi:large subunit ribosomal protein L1
MARIAKKYAEAIKKVDREKRYDMDEALDLLPQMTFAKFDETVELALRLGVDPRHADQMVRGSCTAERIGQKSQGSCICQGAERKRG